MSTPPEATPAARGDAGEQVATLVRDLVRDVSDFPTPGVMFKDISALLSDGPAFRRCVDTLAERAADSGAQLIAGIEARGFIVAAAIASALSVGVVPIRKAGKLPPPTRRLSSQLEYGAAEIELPMIELTGQRVYLADDVLATGGTAMAALALLESVGARVGGIGMLLDLEFLGGRELLAGHDVCSLLRV
jgi:adenine phosphoribosyltransferase